MEGSAEEAVLNAAAMPVMIGVEPADRWLDSHTTDRAWSAAPHV